MLAGCSDGAIRLYGPQSGQLRRVLAGAHQAAVTAVAVAGDGQRLYSGDTSGIFKAWHLGPQSHSMLAALKEHKACDCVAPRIAQCFPSCPDELAFRSKHEDSGSSMHRHLYHFLESFSALSVNINMVG